MVKFQSSRGEEQVEFIDVLLNGLAPDGGLYSPIDLPNIDVDQIKSFRDAVQQLIGGFAPGWITEEELPEILDSAYSAFRSSQMCPIKHLENNTYLLDLTLGPTFAFKDFALSLLGPLLDRALDEANQKAVVLGATSGDTGSAAIHGIKDSKNVSVVMLHPDGKVSDIQRRQMTTVQSGTVTNLAVHGSFDDCQDLVKLSFTDPAIRSEVNLVAVNSINFARVLIQIGYYLSSTKQLAENGELIDIVVPTGNFGNVLAAWYAKKLGAPISDLIVATNSNDSFFDFLSNHQLVAGQVAATVSPSMDIQIPSNLERLLWEVSGKDSVAVANLFADFKANGSVAVPQEWVEVIQTEFTAFAVSDPETLAVIADIHKQSQTLVDPHTAVGIAAARRHQTGRKMMVCETASPGKFESAMEQALGFKPDPEPELAALADLPEHYQRIEADLEQLKKYLIPPS